MPKSGFVCVSNGLDLIESTRSLGFRHSHF